jgi:cysteine desulfurase
MPIYLDCNATAPIEATVRDAVLKFMTDEFGNSGSRTHEYGARAKQAVQNARASVARAVAADPDEIIFTSGATESNNLATLGLAHYGEKTSRRHIVTTQIEHKAILEPLEALQRQGFEISLVPAEPAGYVTPEEIAKYVRRDTLMVSVMQVNNETGVEQPIAEIGELLADHPAYFHVDAAQGFGKISLPLRSPRIDLISISAHKIFGPKGVGALVARRRQFERVPLSPLMYGGGQERGLRPGTLAVPLIVGLGVATDLAEKYGLERRDQCQSFRNEIVRGLADLDPEPNGDQAHVAPHTLNITIPGLDSEAFILATKHLISVSNGSACTSQSYQPSHVLRAMGLSAARINGAVRFSWCHMTPRVDWDTVVEAAKRIRRAA